MSNYTQVDQLSILYQSSEMFLPFAGVSLYSLLKNNGNVVEEIFLVCGNISQQQKDKLESLSTEFHVKIRYINSQEIDEFLNNNGVPRYKDSFAPYYKLFAASYVPDYVKRLLYIDADTVVTGNLDNLRHYNFGNNILAMVYDAIPKKHKAYIGLQGNKYFNSGVVLFDLKKWRELECQQKILYHIQNVRSAYPVADQDLINVVFENRIDVLENQYNWTTLNEQFTYKNLCKIFQLKSEYYYTEKDVNDSRNNVVIYHGLGYFGEQTWNVEGTHPFTKIWDDYLRGSPWKEYSKKKTNRSVINIWQKRLYTILPSIIYNPLHRAAVNYTLVRRTK